LTQEGSWNFKYEENTVG